MAEGACNTRYVENHGFRDWGIWKSSFRHVVCAAIFRGRFGYATHQQDGGIGTCHQTRYHLQITFVNFEFLLWKLRSVSLLLCHSLNREIHVFRNVIYAP